jgi:hypothetical protein
MTVVAVLIILALLFGGIGLLIEGLWWAIIIGLGLLVVGAIVGFGSRGRSGVRSNP